MDGKKVKSPVTPEQIFKVMMIVTFAVAGVFFLKNLLNKSMQGALVIGICLLVFGLCIILMKKMQVPMVKQQLVLSIALVLVVFMISTGSGDHYSDDFILFLAVIGLTGLYLEPIYSIYQSVLCTVLLIVLYVIHPEKADPLPQYIMCLVVFNVTAYILHLLIKRGRAFIELGNMRAEQAEQLLESIQKAGEELNTNYEQSSRRIVGMEEINDNLAGNVLELRKGSESVTEGTRDVGTTCIDAMTQVMHTQEQVVALNKVVKQVENALDENRTNMKTMTTKMQKVREEVGMVTTVFSTLQEQIAEISGVTDQLTSIAASTKMLALNASIEAARAGQSGAGFAVVASKVQELAIDSNSCSDRVVAVVGKMQEQIQKTAEELMDSVSAIEASLQALEGLEEGNSGLTSQFATLYSSIEEQNGNVKGVDEIFNRLRDRIQEMGAYAEENQAMVDAIVTVTGSYRDYVAHIIEDTKQIHELSVSMLEASSEI